MPSGWTCLGLIQHLALDVERFWFGAVVAGDSDVIESLADTANAWQVGQGADPESIFNRYRHEIARASLRSLARRPWILLGLVAEAISSAISGSTRFGKSSCTSSPRRPATPAISTSHAKLIDGRLLAGSRWLIFEVQPGRSTIRICRIADPLFPFGHAEALAREIPGGESLVLERSG
ncbi:MAG: DUF664 domain-containing protein [Thermomicrobiales bacterium]